MLVYAHSLEHRKIIIQVLIEKRNQADRAWNCEQETRRSSTRLVGLFWHPYKPGTALKSSAKPNLVDMF